MRAEDQTAMKVFSKDFTQEEAEGILKASEGLHNMALDEKIGWCLHFTKTDQKKLMKFLKALESRAKKCTGENQKPIYEARIMEVKKLLKQA